MIEHLTITDESVFIQRAGERIALKRADLPVSMQTGIASLFVQAESEHAAALSRRANAETARQTKLAAFEKQLAADRAAEAAEKGKKGGPS
jgi:hypothetical protein